MRVTPVKKERLRALGARLRAVRLAKGLSQQDLAHKIEKDQQSIQRLEAGGVNPSFLYLEEICEGLGISVGNLTDNL